MYVFFLISILLFKNILGIIMIKLNLLSCAIYKISLLKIISQLFKIQPSFGYNISHLYVILYSNFSFKLKFPEVLLIICIVSLIINPSELHLLPIFFFKDSNI